ncbi:hypothetical protein [Treponema denticola]|uniref:hypothetical protein n=1 Tax=Treponema denticola TaxID=158 RepID=UPI0002B54E81|nr:hypothetical protein [Treponema denticola]EMB21294.1 hypothetical protein HMPREF9724_01924 [Treponema denticola SP37]EPF32818.1 hypothetical protein HMPREF9734_02139 [Treponema denticola SP44]EPF40295.1 hypothetical protein HMPREF9731_00155 [Treponema denticola SP23]
MNLDKLKEHIKNGNLNVGDWGYEVLSAAFCSNDTGNCFFTTGCVICSYGCMASETIKNGIVNCSEGCVSGCHSLSCAKCSSSGSTRS